jgi:hypothetical protein
MQLVYNSESFAVMHFGAPAASDGGQPGAHLNASGFEIVDKRSRKEIYLQGAVAESFQRGVKALVDQGPDAEALEDYIACFTVLAQQPVVLH